RVPDPRRRVPAGLGVGGGRRGGDRARRDVHAPRDLGRAAPAGRPGGQRQCARPAARRARDRRPARPLPPRPVRLAEPRLRTRGELVEARLDGLRAMIHKPHVDWFALAPSLSLLAASALLLLVAVLVPRRPRRAVSATLAFAGFVAAGIWAAFLDARSPHAAALVHDAMWRDRWGALAQVILAGCGAVAVLLSYGERMRDEHVAEYYSLLAA